MVIIKQFLPTIYAFQTNGNETIAVVPTNRRASVIALFFFTVGVWLRTRSDLVKFYLIT